MNIYLHVEISSRELDSKLLLAALAASRGHKVIVSDLVGIVNGVKNGVLAPGIFHTKSLSAYKIKINRHKRMIDRGFIITSLDEEGNLNDYGYEGDAKTRFSNQTIEQSAAVFGWGTDDVDTLKRIYPKHSHKIYKTGSPRADLWKPLFSDYWSVPLTVPKKPFLLISSNMAICDSRPFSKMITSQRATGYYERVPELFKEAFIRKSSDYLKAMVFIEAIKYLSKNNNGYDIVFRPHPTEKIEFWKVLMNGIPNLHITNEGSVNAWTQKAFAVMHHGCTTAIETSVSQKTVITYAPPELKDHILNNNLPNELGYSANSKEDLLNKVNSLHDETKQGLLKNNNQEIPSQIFKKIYIDDKELAAEKIIKIWESITNNEISQSINLVKLKFFILKMKINGLIGNVLKTLSLKRFRNFGSHGNDPKFPPLDINEISKKISKLKIILKIDKKIECKLVSERTIVIKCI